MTFGPFFASLNASSTLLENVIDIPLFLAPLDSVVPCLCSGRNIVTVPAACFTITFKSASTKFAPPSDALEFVIQPLPVLLGLDDLVLGLDVPAASDGGEKSRLTHNEKA